MESLCLFIYLLIYIIHTYVFADEIDLLNVSFDGQTAPDRISARAGLKELRRIIPSRK